MEKEYKFITKTNANTVLVPEFLGGDFGKEIDAEVKSKYGEYGNYGRFNTINEITYNEETGLVEGSNPIYVVAVNEILRDNGLKIRTATQADLEEILRTKVMNLEGVYIDSALILRSRGWPNENLAKHLMKQIELRNFQVEPPIMIPLTGLKFRKDIDRRYALHYYLELRDDGEIIHAPILTKKEGYFLSKDINEKTGLPNQLRKRPRKGDRGISIRKSGLVKLHLYDGGLGGYHSDLREWMPSGRVVLVSEDGN